MIYWLRKLIKRFKNVFNIFQFLYKWVEKWALNFKIHLMLWCNCTDWMHAFRKNEISAGKGAVLSWVCITFMKRKNLVKAVGNDAAYFKDSFWNLCLRLLADESYKFNKDVSLRRNRSFLNIHLYVEAKLLSGKGLRLL